MHRQSRGMDPDLFAPSASAGGDLYTKAQPSGSRGFESSRSGARTSFSSQGGYSNDYDQYYQSGNNQLPLEHQSHVGLSLELEHLSGYTGKGKSTIHAHPTDPDSYITCMGSAVVIGKIHDSQSQELLCAHEEEINALSLSNTGALLASAQTSEMVLTKTFPSPVTILNWGKMDEKGRRPKYSLAFAHASQMLNGELAYDITGMQYRLEISTFAMPNVGIARTYLCAAITQTRTDVLAGTAAGELVVFNTDALVYRNAVPVVRNGVHSIVVCGATGYVYVGAGDGVLKKLVGRDSEWNLVGQVQLVGGITSFRIEYTLVG
ncbi:hypothetical protein BBJ29_006695 [Phytophthora kernoviae]|uniref:Uncharacterized protein n=1 Tax=Phytophthora kernoviae TaxID=325452 RepID=A0A3F2RH79_9STRA|nr:hypothetical protein BBP00_00008351 [Phytophthora kernoviae]RLN71698.1 hypothetical protein BBJ29_006695 [Phytophthora kernoviae]